MESITVGIFANTTVEIYLPGMSNETFQVYGSRAKVTVLSVEDAMDRLWDKEVDIKLLVVLHDSFWWGAAKYSEEIET